MVKLKNSIGPIKQIVLLLTVAFCLANCSSTLAVSNIEGKQIPVTDTLGSDEKVEAIVKPYRDNIERDLNTVLAYSPQTLDKSQGKWQTPIGNLMADACLEAASTTLMQREGVKVDMCLLNFGGIRSIIPQGDVTTRTAFEIMPFENSLVVARLKSADIAGMLAYLIKEKKAHPISGLTFTINGSTAEDILVNGRKLGPNDTFLVATSDYLLNGGDNMLFFGNADKVYDIDYKIRNVLIDYFKKVDTIPVKNDIRIKIKE